MSNTASTSVPDVYEQVVVLHGESSTFSVSLRIEHKSRLTLEVENEKAETALEVSMEVELRLDQKDKQSGNSIVWQKSDVSVWADQLYDLLDLSICFHYLAGREDTTELLEDFPNPNTDQEVSTPSKTLSYLYQHQAQWAICQPLFGIYLYLFSKSVPRLQKKRFVTFVFPIDNNFLHASVTSLMASPDAMQEFSLQLRQCYENIQSLTSAP